MGFIAGLTFALTAGSAGLLQASYLHSEASYKSLEQRIRQEKEEFNTCSHCYRDYAYVRLENGGFYPSKRNENARSYATYGCKYCGHTKESGQNHSIK